MQKKFIFLLCSFLLLGLTSPLPAIASNHSAFSNQDQQTNQEFQVETQSDSQNKLKDAKSNDKIDKLRKKTSTRKRTKKSTNANKKKEELNNRKERLKQLTIKRRKKDEEHNLRLREKKAEIYKRLKGKREEFKERLAKIKDERKKKIVEKLDKKYVQINERWTNHLLAVLSRLDQILDKLEVRVGEETSEIAKAREAISSARLAVENQAAKVYTIEIEDESTLKTAVQAIHKQLREDLRNARAQVKTAREAVHEALKAAKEKIGSSEGAPASSSD